MVEEGHQLAEDEGVAGRLQSFTSLKVDLDEKDEGALSMETNGSPSVAFMKKLRRLMGEVLGGVQGQKPSRSATRRMGRLATYLPALVGVVLDGLLGG